MEVGAESDDRALDRSETSPDYDVPKPVEGEGVDILGSVRRPDPGPAFGEAEEAHARWPLVLLDDVGILGLTEDQQCPGFVGQYAEAVVATTIASCRDRVVTKTFDALARRAFWNNSTAIVPLSFARWRS